MFKVLGSLSSLTVAVVMVASASAASATPTLQVVPGATKLSVQEKESVSGKYGCVPPPPPPSCTPLPSKPGYGFGTTGHYGPPGQGFTPSDNWRNHAAGDGLTPSGKALPPRAF